MSSRILRRLQGKINSEIVGDVEDNLETDCSGARRKHFPTNPFNVFIEQSQSESNGEEDKHVSDHSQEDIRDEYKRRKRKKKKFGKSKILEEPNRQEIEPKIDDSEDIIAVDIKETANPVKAPLTICHDCENVSDVLDIKLKNLNANNEMKRMFGSKVVGGNSRHRNLSRVQARNFWLVNPKEDWLPRSKTGLSMRVERNNGTCSFVYEHNTDYQTIQRRFLRAVNSFNHENIVAIIQSFPYHVDALIQLSDICKLTDDLQSAADLNERALYSLEAAFHPHFNMARGICKLDYRRQENRALFICLFKHIIFVGQRACYHTALELCKLLLSFDFELDPLAVVLCIDFYALRSQKHAWLIDVGQKWEKKKNLSLLPNFAFSIALAHFNLTEAGESTDVIRADKLLQDALILFPGVLKLLLDKCSVQVDHTVSNHHFYSDVGLTHNRGLTQLITLYVHRTYSEWKRPNVIQWLEKNVHTVLQRVDSGETFVKDCLHIRQRSYSSTPRNVLRHIFLSDIKEVTATIAPDISSPILGFDPIPPLDSVDLYPYEELSKYEESQSLTSLFFTSLLPNFHVNNRRGNELTIEEAAVVEEVLEPAVEQNGDSRRETRRGGVSMLLDAIQAVVARIPLHNANGEEGNGRQYEHNSDQATIDEHTETSEQHG